MPDKPKAKAKKKARATKDDAKTTKSKKKVTKSASASKKVTKKAAKKTAKKSIKKVATKSKKTTAKKRIVKKQDTGIRSGSRKKKKRKASLSKLCSEMNKMSVDANDKEIIRRFRIIIDTGEEDITKTSLQAILKEPDSINFNDYHESLQPYIKHYIFMIKRERRNAK